MSQPKGYASAELLQSLTKMAQQAKQRSYTHMHIQPGHKVLDVGCGPASDTLAIAQLLGTTGQVIGIDYDEAMIIEANQRVEQAGVGILVKHRQADAAALPYESEEFDSSRSERLFQHLLNPEQALVEMVRVTKTGGWIVVMDTDWGTLSFDTSEVDIERRLARVLAERCFHNGYSGRQLYRLFKRQNLADISIEVFPTFVTDYSLWRQASLLDRAEQEALSEGIITNEELQHWHTSLEHASAEDVFFGMGCMVLVVGRKI